MAYNFFLDSDVILDFLMERSFHYRNSRFLFDNKIKNTANLHTTLSIILNVQYISQKIIGKSKASESIKKLVLLFNICLTSKETILKAYNSSFADVEDAVQYYSAVADNSIDFFVTRNVKDYKQADAHLKIITPTEAVQILA